MDRGMLRPTNYAVGFGAGCQLRLGSLLVRRRDGLDSLEGSVDPHPRHRKLEAYLTPTRNDEQSLSVLESLRLTLSLTARGQIAVVQPLVRFSSVVFDIDPPLTLDDSANMR